MTQYDPKTLLFTVNPEDMGQRITGLAEGAIESMHNLPVSLAGSKLSDGINGSEAAINEVPEFTGGVNAVEAFEVAVFRLLNIDGKRSGKRNDLRELLPLGIIVWLDFCHCSLLS